MLYYKKKMIIKFCYEILLCSRYRVYLLIKKLIKFWSIFSMQLRKRRFFCLARGVLLDNGVTSPWVKSIFTPSDMATPSLNMPKVLMHHKTCLVHNNGSPCGTFILKNLRIARAIPHTWPKATKEKQFRISCGHGWGSKGHDQEKLTSQSLDHEIQCKAD